MAPLLGHAGHWALWALYAVPVLIVIGAAVNTYRGQRREGRRQHGS